ncbi:phenol 2-monooxygenase [Enemella dayhoffiae]|uniref:Phenol 2-monooxygenase n=1 Tax=Enemella dayhoffiae TaxID=2016507 RepID=A0A255H5U0_9ACTN|nr:FAD-binding monooxygenase [Enemella dayhoffiae]OYO21884.1 phenol 2-monooxygenase [Enemella dayhoffiae]
MQFHLNGHQLGDPAIQQPGPNAQALGSELPDEVDVLIVGCGPAGLVLAAQLAQFPDLSTRIVERRPGPLQLGQADGVACRTVEVFEALGFGEKIRKEAYWVNETVFWNPDPERPEHIVRTGRITDTEEGLSEMPHVIVNQARVHDWLLESMRNSVNRLEPDYGWQLADLSVGEGEYPVTVTLERVQDRQVGESRQVRARYVVGCDGARSRVRPAMGRELHGDPMNQAWGVMDVLAVTDFPDIRLKAAIHSATEGNVLIIPREGGYLVRLYIELDELAPDQHLSTADVNPESLIERANRILHPYRLDVRQVAWWSVYEIGQRLTDRFDDVPADQVGQRKPRVFIAGDACHTHSAKAGQGMNVSLNDTFNLGWKLASVLRGVARPELLSTYSDERHAIAQELIDFDREFAKMFSAPPKGSAEDDGDGVTPEEFQAYFVKQGRFTAGTATRYAPSLIVAGDEHQGLAEGFPIGMRFQSAPAIRLADAKPVQLAHDSRADGAWRLYAFADRSAPGDPASAIARLCTWLDSAESPVRRFTPQGWDVDQVIDVRAVLQQYHRDLALGEMPPFLLPRKGRLGLVDYEKLYCADLRPGQDVFDLRGIDRDRGALVVARPDQYVADVLPLDDTDRLAAFFDRILR